MLPLDQSSKNWRWIKPLSGLFYYFFSFWSFFAPLLVLLLGISYQMFSVMIIITLNQLLYLSFCPSFSTSSPSFLSSLSFSSSNFHLMLPLCSSLITTASFSFSLPFNEMKIRALGMEMKTGSKQIKTEKQIREQCWAKSKDRCNQKASFSCFC